MIGIYKIQNIKTGKVYVGSSINIKARFNGHKYLLRKNKSHSPKLQNSYNKYGKENFIYSIIQNCEKAELKEVERFWIDIYNSVNNGYNCSNDTICSTRGMKHSKESKLKMSKAQKIAMNDPKRKKISSKTLIEYNKNLAGIPKSNDHRKRISLSNTGKKKSKKQKLLQSQRLKDNPVNYWKGKKMPIEMRKKISAALKGNSNKSKRKIIQYDLSGNFIKDFSSATEAGNILGISRTAIKNCLRGLSKTSGNFKWGYDNGKF